MIELIGIVAENGAKLIIDHIVDLGLDAGISGIKKRFNQRKLKKALKEYVTIVQSKWAFRQTVTGIRNLLAKGERVDLRFVVSSLNHRYITEMAEFVIRYLPEVASVKVMGLEMTGNAAVNRERVWIPYEEAFRDAKKGIDLLIGVGIDVELYNFPLCTVDPGYWGLCCRSITDTKINYLPECDACKVRHQCGGIFYSSKNFVKQVHPVRGESRI